MACFDDLQVGDFVEVDVSRSIEVLLGDQDTFYEKLAVKFKLVAQSTGERRDIPLKSSW